MRTWNLPAAANFAARRIVVVCIADLFKMEITVGSVLVLATSNASDCCLIFCNV